MNRVPYPLHDGGAIGIHYYLEGFLEAGVSLSMLAMNTSRHYVDTAQLPPIYTRLQHFKAVAVDNSIRPAAALLSLLKGTSYNIERFVSAAYEAALIRLLQQERFDIVQLEGLYLTPYLPVIRRYSKARVVIRQHNIEFRIWERLAARSRNPLKKAYLSMLARRLKRFELNHMNGYDLVLPISEEDELFFKSLGAQSPTYLHPFGVDVQAIPFCPAAAEPLSLYHIGAMDWLPNQESVNWLLEQVMPLIREQLPETKLYLAGRNMPAYYRERHWENVEILGEVPDALLFEQDKSILVVPLLSGGGVRIKIFQALAMGKTVITTSIGLEGIHASDGAEVFIADTPEAFAQKIIGAVRHPETVLSVGTAARRLIEARYDRRKLMEGLLKRYSELAGDTGPTTVS